MRILAGKLSGASGAAFLWVALAKAASAQVPEVWRVPEAPLRFEYNVVRQPSHPEAGYVVEIPDGGLLPERGLDTVVFNENGAPVDSYVLWHGQAQGLLLALAASGTEKRFTIYVQRAGRYRIWTPETGLAPGPILATDPSQASLRAAAALAVFGPVGGSVHFVRKAGVDRAPLSIAGDETGRPRPASFYLLAHLVSADPGRTWVAPFTLSGMGEVRINGTTLKPAMRIDKWGGTGDWAEIRPGANRLEVFHSAPGVEGFFTEETGGLMYLTWRTPNAGMEELGGVRSSALPMAGTSRLETRLIREDEIMRSGACTLARADSRDGRPVPVIRIALPRTYWFGDETPLLAYTFEALSAQSSGTYTWTMPDGMTVETPRFDWILPGLVEHRVSLAAAGGGGAVMSAYRTFFGFSTRATSLNSADDRRAFRAALRQMAETSPPGHRTVREWDTAIWRTMLRTMEPGKGAPLLRALFTRHADVMARRIDTQEFEALQDLFIQALARIDPEDAFQWASLFARDAPDLRRQGELALISAELMMYYRRDLDAAEAIIRSVHPRDVHDLLRLQQVRLGDLALLRGDLNEATRLYAAVQADSRMRRSVADRNVALDGSTAPLAERRARLGATMDQYRPGDWKLFSIVDAATSESVRSLIAQDYLVEAGEMLRLWERDLPLSKITADFVLLEARYYRAIDDPIRALGLLRAFCNTVEASAVLPEAAPLLLNLMLQAGEPSETIRAYAERFGKSLEFHPVARELDAIAARIPAATPSRREAKHHE